VTEGSAALAVVRGVESELSAPERKFCAEYFGGDHADNATRSYLVAYPNANISTAGSMGPALLKQPRIGNYLARLREQAIQVSAAEFLPWVSLLPRAQAILLATAEGRLRSRLQFEAAIYLVNRVLGSPVAQAEISLLDQGRITGAIKNLTRRMTNVEVA